MIIPFIRAEFISRSPSIKIGILAFEARDSLLMRIVTKLNLAQEYEHAAVFYNNCSHGGVNNTQIPNYVCCRPNDIRAKALVIFRVTKVSPLTGDS